MRYFGLHVLQLFCLIMILSACVERPVEVVNIEVSACLESTHLVQVGAPYDACRVQEGLPTPVDLTACFVWQNESGGEFIKLKWRNGWTLDAEDDTEIKLAESPQLRMSFFVGQSWFACSGLAPETDCSAARGCLVKLTNGRFEQGGQAKVTFGDAPESCSVLSNLPSTFASCVECGGICADRGPPLDAEVDMKMPICGNAILEDGEACDDGNRITEVCEYGETECEVCNENCQLAFGDVRYCGDGLVDDNERCDDGAMNAKTCDYGATSCSVCTRDCQLGAGTTSFCGDGRLDEMFEECEPSASNAETCDYGATSCSICTRDCQLGEGTTSFCGDGRLDEMFEECEPSASNAECAYGDTTCMICDDRCKLNPGNAALCGDEIIQEAYESCDDGNAVTESCPYNALSCLICDDSCQTTAGPIHACGDGVLSANEECDDGNRRLERCEDSDAGSCTVCDPNCRVTAGLPYESCGDGVVEVGERCELEPSSPQVNSLLADICGSNCNWLDGANARDVIGIYNSPLTMRARLSVRSDQLPLDPETVDLDIWIIHHSAIVNEPMIAWNGVATARLNNRIWMGETTIEESGNHLAINFRGGGDFCSARVRRTLIGIRSANLSIAGDGRHPTDVHVTLEQAIDPSATDTPVILFEKTFRMEFEDYFAVIGLISLCGTGGEPTLFFTGFEGNSFIDFHPGDPDSDPN